MASNRPTKETIYVRRNFTQEERLEMGTDLAQAHNRMASISEDEATMKAQIKERRTAVEAAVGSISRKINDGFDMANVACELKWDTPNVGEVSYIGPDGSVVKTRAMTFAERQEELNFDESTSTPAPTSVEESAANIAEFFDNTANAETVGGKPSAADLDTVAEEQSIADSTGDATAAAPEDDMF